MRWSVLCSHVEHWRSTGLLYRPARQLLAEGVAALDALVDDPQPRLRWYRSTDAALVLGRGQHTDDFLAAELPVVGRFSGGGAVLMDDGLLCLDVIVPTGHPLVAGELSAAFLRVGQAWAQAMTALGVADIAVASSSSRVRRQGTDRERLLAAICYATLGTGEVTSGGRKIVGLAQRRRRHGALIQCGLLRRWQPEPLLRALGAAADDRQILTAAAGIDQLLEIPPADDGVMTAVQDALDGVLARL